MACKRKQAVKETASAAPQVQVKKAKKDARLTQQLKEIVSAWKTAPISEEVKVMLTEVLPSSLGEFSDKRHKFQEQVVNTVAGILGEVEANLHKMVEERRSEQEDATSNKPLREKEAAEVTQQLEDAKAETQSLKVALAEAAKLFRNAQKSLAEGEEVKRLDAQKSVEAGKKKTHLETALEDLRVLQAIAPEEAEASKKQDELVTLLKKYKFEESIMIALPAALAKAPDSRGQFDLMAIGQLEAEISKMIAEQESILAAAKPGQDKCEAAVLQAQELLNNARVEQRAAAKTYDSSSTKQAACEDASATAQKAIRDLGKVSARLKNNLLDAEVQVELFQQGPKETFNVLRERATPVPVEEAVVPVMEESAAMEEQAMETLESEVPAVPAC